MLRLHARAKINWTLDVLGTREDGYHLLDMLMQSVALHDTLWLEPAPELSLTLESGGAPSGPPNEDGLSAGAVTAGPENLVWQAAERLRRQAGSPPPGARMRLVKRIPSGAGLGGGSADAAAALAGLNRLWGLGLTDEALRAIGLSLGADVPFQLLGGLARVGGVGERLEPLPPPPPLWLTLVQPCGGLSTREVFRAFDALPAGSFPRPDTARAREALVSGDLGALARAMQNALEGVSLKRRPAMARALSELEALGAARAMMTGSGSVVYGVFERRADAERARAALSGAYPACLVTRTERAPGVVVV